MDRIVDKTRRRVLLGAGAAVLLAPGAQAAPRDASRQVSIEEFGAQDGQDATVALQQAIDAHPVVLVPYGKTYLVDSIKIPSNRRLVIDGKLLRAPKAPSDSYMITNASGTAGDANIVIEGAGELDGNAADQSGDRQGLVRLQKPAGCRVRIRKAGNNRYSVQNPTTSGQGCIVFIDAVDCHISVRELSLWQREGLFIDGASTKCSITNVNARGDGVNSWTATSISGAGATGNRISDIVAENCGASSVGLDSTYSQVLNVTSRNNQFQNGVNFGHKGKPATGSRGSNIMVINAGQSAAKGTTHNGVSIGGSTTDFELSNVTVAGAHGHCINISDGASHVQVKGTNRLTGSRHGSGVHAWTADGVRVAGVSASDNADYGVNFNAGNDCAVTDSDLRGNRTGAFNATGGGITLRNTPCSEDPMTGNIDVTETGEISPGATVTVRNRNVFGASSAIELQAGDGPVAAAGPYVVSKAKGSFVVGFTGPCNGAAHMLAYRIL